MNKSPREFPYQIVLPKMKNQWKADSWCVEHFGKRWSPIDNKEGVWCCFWRGRSVPGSYEWFFINEQDFLLFTLKWT